MATDSDATWEYETVRPPREVTMREAADPKDLLNEFGSEGWEFVDTIDYAEGGTKYLVFKRRGSGDDDD
ncbi:DUF4177 domain-containing protein [Natronosalvus caseinilyticus]|uniref:DUF4177 domain-containing protein n=1 Tax=Natronosalvus caseinilyticus TaxID=2953747 RepID=UPI0028AA94E6|nr:DUF4177 domain-containing protein [Natronosalvus caseinilyticus]